jgi:Predicted transcriptional regulator
MYSYELRIARVVFGATQSEVAEMLGITPAHLSTLESGRNQPTDSLMRKFSKEILQTDRFRNNLQLFNESVQSALRRYK